MRKRYCEDRSFESQNDILATRRTEVTEFTELCVQCAAEVIMVEMELACQDLVRSPKLEQPRPISKRRNSYSRVRFRFVILIGIVPVKELFDNTR